MYDFYDEPRQLNIKKVVIIAVILVIIIISTIVLIARKISKPKDTSENITTTETTTIFYSTDKSISVELPNSFNLKQYEPKLNYLLELRSENNLDIFISEEKALQNRNLSEIANADKTAYLSNFSNYSNLSEIKELSVNNNLAYTYSFHYLDKNLNKAFYLQVIWLQIDDKYYIFDIEFPLDDLTFNINVVTSVLSTFTQTNLQ